MSGLWERLANRSTDDSDPLAAHTLRAALYLVARGVFTGQQVRAALEKQLRAPFSAAEVTDLLAIIAQLGAQSTAAGKLDYLERVHALAICVETGLLTTESKWRSELGIS